jgi:hypothetical protein
MSKLSNFKIKVTSENSRLWMGAIGFVTCLYVFVATCIFGKNGAPEHIELTKYTMAIS